MALTLQVTSFHSGALGPASVKVFDNCGGAIGRSQDNDWVLPDADKFVSSHHAHIVHRGGAYYLKDTSTNGTFINGSPQPVGNNMERQLHHGDRITIGDYEICATLDNAAQPAATGPQTGSGWANTGGDWSPPPATGPQTGGGWQSTGAGTPPYQPTGGPSAAPPVSPGPMDSGGSIDDLLNGPAQPEPPAWPGVQSNHSSALDDSFAPPPIESPPGAQGFDNAIPEDWNKTEFDPVQPAPSPLSDTMNRPFTAEPPMQPQPMPPPAQQPPAGGIG